MAYTENTPGTWCQGQFVHRGDIFEVTQSDANNNGNLVKGDLYQAVSDFTCDTHNSLSWYPKSGTNGGYWKYFGHSSASDWTQVMGPIEITRACTSDCVIA